MAEQVSLVERIRAFLVLAATIGTIAFNWIAELGYVGGVTTGQVSDDFPTIITPAGYAFSIWSLIYAGLLVFSIYQLLPKNIERYRAVRSLYIFSSALNCAWLFFWHSEQVAVCLAIIAALLIVLFVIDRKLPEKRSGIEALLVRGTFGIYLGWVSVATLVNFAVVLSAGGTGLGLSHLMGAGLILLAAAFGVFLRVKLLNYFAPLAIAWGLAAIAVKQSGATLVVAAAAVGVIACLIASLSFVVGMPSAINRPGRGGE